MEGLSLLASLHFLSQAVLSQHVCFRLKSRLNPDANQRNVTSNLQFLTISNWKVSLGEEAHRAKPEPSIHRTDRLADTCPILSAYRLLSVPTASHEVTPRGATQDHRFQTAATQPSILFSSLWVVQRLKGVTSGWSAESAADGPLECPNFPLRPLSTSRLQTAT